MFIESLDPETTTAILTVYLRMAVEILLIIRALECYPYHTAATSIPFLFYAGLCVTVLLPFPISRSLDLSSYPKGPTNKKRISPIPYNVKDISFVFCLASHPLCTREVP